MTIHLDKKGTRGKSQSAKRVSSGNKKGKQSIFNKYLTVAMALLKEQEPELDHAGRLKMAAERWKTDQHNPKNQK